MLEPGVVEIIFAGGKTIEESDIQALREINLKITKGKPYGVLVQAEELVNFTREVRELLASETFKGNTKAKALITNGLGQKLLGNFYLKVNKPHIKTRLFTSREKALAWLREELKNYQ